MDMRLENYLLGAMLLFSARRKSQTAGHFGHSMTKMFLRSMGKQIALLFLISWQLGILPKHFFFIYILKNWASNLVVPLFLLKQFRDEKY